MKCKCGKEYEQLGHRYQCLECRREYDKDWRKKRVAKGLSVRGKRPSADWWTAYNKEYANRPGVKERKAEQMRKYAKNPELRFKMVARWALRRAVKAGKLFREACSNCGESKSQAHHTDYSKPLLVVWLCRKCHQLEHTKAEGKE